jgi:hypothetical protein
LPATVGAALRLTNMCFQTAGGHGVPPLQLLLWGSIIHSRLEAKLSPLRKSRAGF